MVLNFLYHIAQTYSNTKTIKTLGEHLTIKKFAEDV